jgi:iron complex outermembrane receptor protein
MPLNMHATRPPLLARPGPGHPAWPRLLLAATLGWCAAAATANVNPAADGSSADAELSDLLSTPVYAASKYTQSAAEAPASVTVLTQGDIRAFGWRTLGDVLGGVRSVFLRYDRGYTYAGVRGLSRPGDYSSRLLLLIDGQRANENVYDSVMVGREFPLDVALIERVEFIPGALSALYGSNAVFGVINVVTRSSASLRGRQASVSVDSQGGRKLQASLGQELEQGALLLSVTAENRRGRDLYLSEYDSAETNQGIAQGLDGERDRKLYARWTAGNWSLTALTSERRKQVPNAAYEMVFNDPAALWIDQLSLLGLNWQGLDAQGEGWSLQAGAGEYRYDDRGRYQADGALAAYRNRGRWWQLELRRSLRLGSSQRLVAGLDLQRNLRQEAGMTQLEPAPAVDSQASTQGTRAGLFVNDEVKLGEHLRLGLGLRLDRATAGSGVHTSPRASLIWQPASTLVTKFLAGSAYREPNVYERLPANGVDTWLTGLRREQVRSTELAADWQAHAGLRLSGALFHNHIRDLIEQVADADSGELVYRNVGRATARGLETEAEWIGDAGWRLRASWVRQSVQVNGSANVSNAPRSLTKLHATTPLPGWPVKLGLQLQRVGQRRTLAGQPLNGAWLATATAQLEPPGQPWSLSLSVYNLGDRRYADPAGPEHLGDRIEQDGRSASLRWQLGF